MSNIRLVGREVWRDISKKYQADLSWSLVPLSFTACFEICSWQYPPVCLVTRGKGVFISPVEVGKPALWVWGGWIQRRRDISIQRGWWCWCYWSSLSGLLLSGVRKRANKQHETLRAALLVEIGVGYVSLWVCPASLWNCTLTQQDVKVCKTVTFRKMLNLRIYDFCMSVLSAGKQMAIFQLNRKKSFGKCSIGFFKMKTDGFLKL